MTDKPKIYGFSNGGSPGFYHAVAIAADGTILGEHICSHEGFMPGDLGMTPGKRPGRHEKDYAPHYPDGYEMEFVPSSEIDGHAGLQRAFELNKAMGAAKAAEADQ